MTLKRVRSAIEELRAQGVSILGLVGYGRAGKDTVADVIIQACPEICDRFAFADPIKEDVAACLKRYKEVWAARSNKPLPKEMVRQIYITHGTRVGNSIDPTMWVAELFRRMKKSDKPFHIITDVRRLAEADALLNIPSVKAHLLVVNRADVQDAQAADITEALSIAELLDVYRQVPARVVPVWDNDSDVKSAFTATLLEQHLVHRALTTYRDDIADESARYRWDEIRRLAHRQLGELIW